MLAVRIYQLADTSDSFRNRRTPITAPPPPPESLPRTALLGIPGGIVLANQKIAPTASLGRSERPLSPSFLVPSLTDEYAGTIGHVEVISRGPRPAGQYSTAG